MAENNIDSIPDCDLLFRAVKGARIKARKNYKYPRWTAVAHVFGLGSSYAAQLCRRYNLDPEEYLSN